MIDLNPVLEFALTGICILFFCLLVYFVVCVIIYPWLKYK